MNERAKHLDGVGSSAGVAMMSVLLTALMVVPVSGMVHPDGGANTAPSDGNDFKKPELSGLDNTPDGGTLPGGTVPGGTVPGGTVPGGTVPGGTVPGGTVPGGTFPNETVPGGTLRGGTFPNETVPGGTLPGGTLPGDTESSKIFSGDDP
jgi:hypothetical protein